MQKLHDELIRLMDGIYRDSQLVTYDKDDRLFYLFDDDNDNGVLNASDDGHFAVDCDEPSIGLYDRYDEDSRELMSPKTWSGYRDVIKVNNGWFADYSFDEVSRDVQQSFDWLCKPEE